MKKIILLLAILFVASFINAQSDLQPINYEWLKEYQGLCYIDSTVVKEHFIPPNAEGYDKVCIGTSYGWDDFTCDNPHHYNREIWVHAQPTFEGFIEFLDKKLQRKSKNK